MGRCMVVWGVANGTRARAGMMYAPIALLPCYDVLPKKHGGRIYEKLALRKQNLLQGDLPPERTAKETGTI